MGAEIVIKYLFTLTLVGEGIKKAETPFMLPLITLHWPEAQAAKLS
jgi:hypothetical protein